MNANAVVLRGRRPRFADAAMIFAPEAAGYGGADPAAGKGLRSRERRSRAATSHVRDSNTFVTAPRFSRLSEYERC
jgi:hypothetical protein